METQKEESEGEQLMKEILKVGHKNARGKNWIK